MSIANNDIRSILTGKDYVGSVGENSFATKKGGYEIPYSSLNIHSLPMITALSAPYFMLYFNKKNLRNIKLTEPL